jgi:hypothetical protein
LRNTSRSDGAAATASGSNASTTDGKILLTRHPLRSLLPADDASKRMPARQTKVSGIQLFAPRRICGPRARNSARMQNNRAFRQHPAMREFARFFPETR